jgi:hypothetical protein
MNYFASTEIGIANLLQRHYDWTANTLFFEEIPHALDPSRNKFIVANDDVVLCAPVSPPQTSRICCTKADDGMFTQRIKKYLMSHGVRSGLYFNSQGQHGLALIPGTEGFNELMTWLKEPEHY